MKIRINNNALKKIENSQVAPIVHAEARRRIEKSLREAQREMLQQFESHPVTQEIDMGPDGYNSSGTLGGYGNLYSFIGFEEGMDPIAPIRMLLKKALKIKNSPNSHKSMITNFIIELPSKEEIFSATPNPWASGRSWAEGIENPVAARYAWSDNPVCNLYRKDGSVTLPVTPFRTDDFPMITKGQ